MSTLLIFPPQWVPISPYFAMLTLLGQFRAKEIPCRAIDLNIDFYNTVLSKGFLENSLELAYSESAQAARLKELTTFYQKDKDFNSYTLSEQVKLVKYSKIKDFIQSPINYRDLPLVAEDAVSIIKSEHFYEPKDLIQALNIIDLALDLVSIPYAPSKLSFEAYINPLYKLDYENIKHFVFCKETNMFRNYFESKIDEILASNPDYIGVSVNSSSQIIPALTLTNILKEKSKAHINIGGNFFGRVIETVAQKKDFFELFCDSILIEEGEKPCIELSKAISGEINFADVPNLVYKEGDEIKVNPKTIPTPLNELADVSFDGFEKYTYFSPKIVLPHQTSKGCYWGKCSFCDQDFGQNFNVKDVDKLVGELSRLKEKWNIDSFEFIDESISPSYMEELAKKLIDTDLKVNYFCNARLEKAFTKDILNAASQSGLKMILWGLESGSDKIMKLINKGIDIDKRLEIMKDAKDAGIWNFAFIFFGFPAETHEDAIKTIEMLEQNTDVISSYGRSVFTMGKHTKLRDNPEVYGLTKVNELEEELSPSYSFECIGMPKNELNEIIKLCTKRANKAYNNPLWMYLRHREYLFLYVAKYGVDWVEKYSLDNLGER